MISNQKHCSPFTGVQAGEQTNHLLTTATTTNYNSVITPASTQIVSQRIVSSDEDSDNEAPPAVEFPHNLSLPLLSSLVAAAKPTLQQIRNKDVVVVLGNTGTGKSTLLHVLAGNKLCKKSYQLVDSGVEKTVYEAMEPLEGFAIGHSQKSQTKHLMHYIQPPCPPLEREVVFLDSAGFEDTAGIEVDIATAISLSKVAQECCNLRFVVLISCMSLLESRGGAFRALVRLMARLVGNAETEDLDKLRLVFTFLFTHTGALSEHRLGSCDNEQVCGNDAKLSQISHKLQSLLKDTRRGTETKEPAVRKIIKWMQRCLFTGSPFVGIFHPDLTSRDFLLDATTIFSKIDGRYTALGMEEGHRPHDEMKFGVTRQQEIAVQLEADQLGREFNKCLEQDQIDLLRSVCDSMDFLFLHVELQCVKRVYMRATTELNNFIITAQHEVHQVVERLTDENVLEIEEDDSEAWANRSLKQASLIQELLSFKMIDNSLDSSAKKGTNVVVFLCAQLRRLSDMIINEPAVWKKMRWLEKLNAWAHADRHLHLTQGVAGEIVEHAKKAVSHSITYLFASCDITFKKDPSHQRIGGHIEFASATGHLKKLLTIRDRMHNLGMCALELGDIWLHMEHHLEGILEFHVKGGQKALLDQSRLELIHTEALRLEDFEEHVLCLDTLVVSLVDVDASCEIISKSSAALRSVLDEAKKCVEEHAAVVDGTCLREGQFGPIVNNHVVQMKLLVSVFNKVRCEERLHCDQSKKLYDTTLKRLGSSVQAQLTQLEGLCNRMFQEGFTAPESHSQLLKTLEAFRWLDIHSGQESRSVTKSVEKFKETYLKQHDTLQLQFVEKLHQYLESPTHQQAVLGMLQEISIQEEKLSLFCSSNIYAIVDKQKQFAETIGSAIQSWCSDINQILEYPENPEKLNTFPAIAANSALMACEELQKVTSAAWQMAHLHNKLLEWLRSSSLNIRTLMQERGHFASKQIVLDTLLGFQEQGLLHVTKQLPSMADLQAMTMRGIAAHASYVRERIAEAPNATDIDAALMDVADACCLDRHVNQRASTELDSLTRLIQAKRAGLDSHLTDRIQAFEFDEVEDHLCTLSQSKDAQHQARFQKLISVVESAVKSKIALGEKQIGHGPKVADTYMLLQKANECVGKLLKQHKGALIQDAIKSLKRNICDHVKALMKQLQSAQSEKDHPQIWRLMRVLDEYIQSTKSLIDIRITKQASALLNKGKICKGQFENLVKHFLNIFKDDTVNTAELHSSLRSWKIAMASNQLDPRDVSEYQELMRWLGDSLNDHHASIEKHVKADAQYAPAVHVYTLLIREWETGLKDHVPGLKFDPADVLDKYKLKEQEANALSERCFMDVNNNSMVLKLDALKGKWTFGGLIRHDVYADYKKKLVELMVKLVNDVNQNSESQSYELFAENVKLLTYRRKEMHHHIDGNCEFIWRVQQMEKSLLQTKSRMEQDLIATLDRSNLYEFADIFRHHLKFLKVLIPYMGETGTSCNNAVLHESVYKFAQSKVKFLQDQLGAYEFEEAFKLIEVLRRLGMIIAGDFSSYLEMSRAFKAIDDKWYKLFFAMQENYFGGTPLRRVAKHYSVLELEHEATQKDVESAFRRMSLKSHPDKPRGSSEKMHLLEEAKTALCNASVRNRCQGMLRELFRQDILNVPENFVASVKQLLENARYKSVSKMLEKLRHYHQLTSLVSGTISEKTLIGGVHELVKGHVSNIHNNVDVHWDKREFKDLQDDFTRLASIDSNLSSFSTMQVGEWIKNIRQNVEREIGALAKTAIQYLDSEKTALANIKDFALQLIHLGRILDDLPRFKYMASEKIHILLQTCQEKPIWGVPFLFKLGMELERGTVGRLDSDKNVMPEDQRVGRVLVSEFKQFGDVLTWIWNEKVTRQDVASTVHEMVSNKVTGSRHLAKDEAPINHELLLEGFKQYEHEYNLWFHKWYTGNATLEDISQRCMADAKKLGPCRTDAWKHEVRMKIPSLLGAIFAYLTISKSGQTYIQLTESFGGDSSAEKPDGGNDSMEGNSESPDIVESMLVKPHNIQIISILRLLGYDMHAANDCMVKHLMQIRTGEGKSMILGACSVVLGLLGFSVRCICYSKYLSERDLGSFAEIFAAFGVASSVKYSTINEYCQDVIYAKGDLNELTRELLLGNVCSPKVKTTYETNVAPGSKVSDSTDNMSNTTQCTQEASQSEDCTDDIVPTAPSFAQSNIVDCPEEILLVDEVDVFFGKDFYGNTLNCGIAIRTPQAKALMQKIWENRNKFRRWSDHFEAVVRTTEYADMLKQCSDWVFLLEHEVREMCHDAQYFEFHKYSFDSTLNRVGYKQMDSMDYHCWYGYYTMFAYLNEAAKHNLHDPDKTLEKELGMKVRCGSQLYSDIKPACILGVSGTVEALGRYEWEVMNKYGIDVYTRMPSVYGQSNFHFLDQAGDKQLIVVSTKEEYFREITDVANKVVNNGRAVVVFFNDNAMLTEYTMSNHYAKVINKGILDETLAHEEKDHIIKKAATAGQVTFTTAIFGRGTDFHCYDRQVLTKGGVHIIQTFLSESKMEEIQIQGRTARQGAEGTYSMVLLETALQSLDMDISAESARQLTKSCLYNFLDEKRQKRHEESCKRIDESLEKNVKIHELTHRYFDALLASDSRLAFELGKELWLR